MLDTKKVGIKISTLRKSIGYSQEKLAEILCISPQAISKWENGHALPDTTLLPVLAQIFNCKIDDIIIPAYSFDEKIEEERSTVLEQQAEHIAKYILKKMEDKVIPKTSEGISDDTIAEAVFKKHGHMGNITIHRENPSRVDGKKYTKIVVSSHQKEIKMIETIYRHNDTELQRYAFLSGYISDIPYVYHIDVKQKAILLEDLSGSYIPGYNFDEKNEDGNIIRANYNKILQAAANFHSTFWENQEALSCIGPEWRLETPENLLAHLSSCEKDFKKYRKNEEAGKIPKIWEAVPQCGENNINKKQFDYFVDAINFLKKEYVKLVDTRFNTGKNITIIHGDMHPGSILMSLSAERDIKFTGLQAVRIGLCTEDLAMLLALHIEPEKSVVSPLLDYYYNSLTEKVKDYSYDTFINDYKISVAENMFFTIRHINHGIFDFRMRDKAIKAYETFIL